MATEPEYVWQDRELRFDSPEAHLACRSGEKIIDSINSVEDTKGHTWHCRYAFIGKILMTTSLIISCQLNCTGNNGERGALIVTNLRIIWISHAHARINLSKISNEDYLLPQITHYLLYFMLLTLHIGVGFNTLLTLNIRKAKSKLRGTTQALCVLAKFNSRFEFIFTSLVKNSPRLFSTCQAVLR